MPRREIRHNKEVETTNSLQLPKAILMRQEHVVSTIHLYLVPPLASPVVRLGLSPTFTLDVVRDAGYGIIRRMS